MALTTLTCPHCGFSKGIEATRLPAPGTTVHCPKCRGRFLLQPATPLTGEPDPAFAAFADAAIPPDGTPPPAAEPPRNRSLSFNFKGNAKEYFGIWVVNTLLRIVTFGIYSPWAKVRKRRYFYGNTLLDDAAFDYLADPLAILKGWFIAGAFLGLYSLLSNTSPIASAVMMLVFMAVYPWVLVRSRIFNLRNSSHRNIRFAFRADYREAYRVYLWWTLLIPLTLGFLAPYVLYRQKRFLVENSAYGSTFFTFDATHKQYYRVFFPLLAIVPLFLAVVAALSTQPRTNPNPALVIAFSLLTVAFYVFIALYLPTALSNITWNGTSIAGHRFRSTLRARDLAWIYFSNAVAALCSLGLLAPWGAVRLAKYRLEKLSLSGAGGLDAILAAENAEMGATGEELGELLGWDFGL